MNNERYDADSRMEEEEAIIGVIELCSSDMVMRVRSALSRLQRSEYAELFGRLRDELNHMESQYTKAVSDA